MHFLQISALLNTVFLPRFLLNSRSVEFGDQQLNLQSGMGVSANIKLRSRPVITIISDLFTKQMDGVKRFR